MRNVARDKTVNSDYGFLQAWQSMQDKLLTLKRATYFKSISSLAAHTTHEENDSGYC